MDSDIFRDYPSVYSKNIRILSSIAIILLLIPPSNHLFDYENKLPYWYFILLRWSISIISLIFIYLFLVKIKSDYFGWIWGYFAVLFFFKPISPLHMSEISWIVWDMLAAFYFYKSYSILKKQTG
jgi:hypothetical protein